MSFAAPPRQPAPNRAGSGRSGPSPLAITVLVVAAIVGFVLLASHFWTEILWYQQVGYQQVLFTEWGTRAALFAVAFVLMAAVIYVNLSIAYKNRPIYAPSNPEQATLDQYREAIEPLRKVVMVGGPMVIGLFAGLTAQASWDTFQLWLNKVPFGIKDPEFNLDYSFYVFTLPVLNFAVNFLLTALVMAAIGAVATHYLYGGVTIGSNGRGGSASTSARIQLSVLSAVFVLVLGAKYWLDRYGLLLKSGDKFDGATYADINAVIPAKAILAVVAVFVALLFIATAIRGNWRLPAIGVGLMIVSAVVVGAIYPAIVQRFQVVPNAQQMEAPYIQRNIDATRAAFGLDNIDVRPYDAKTTAEAQALRDYAETAASIRLLDPTIVSPSFRQLQQNRGYYNFAQNLAVDRYTLEDKSRDTVIAVRELDLTGLATDQRNWVNDHTVYTHGFGVVAAYGNQIGVEGRPAFFEGGIPSVGALTDSSKDGYEPRIYFSPMAPAYSIVGAPEGTEARELDYPTDEGSGQVNTTFPTRDISVGPSVGNTWNKLLFAIKFQAEQIVFSALVNEDSQIIYERDPAKRVAKVAPYLTLDNRVYPAVIDGRVKWIIDGYTTTNSYPYSTSEALDEATATLAGTNMAAVQALMPQEVNYIRNSVKATVDAYDGSVNLYAWDAKDPILQAWQNVFPTSIEPMANISGELMSHIRYPEDMFKVQRSLLTKYHVDTAAEFFSGQDFWRNPDDPTSTRSENTPTVPQPPYYQTLQMPGQDDPTFSLSTSFIAGGSGDRNVLTGYLAVNAEAGNEAGKPNADYGQLRLLELPRGSTIPGPGQVQNNFDSDSDIATTIGLLKSKATVVNGNLLTLPVGGGLLYVQPVYVQAQTGTKFPLLRKVLVSFGDEVQLADTLDEALDLVFGGDSGVDAGDAEIKDDEIPIDPPTGEPSGEPTDQPTTEPTDKPTTEPTTDPTTPVAPGVEIGLDQALKDAQAAMQDSDKALRAGDFAAYGEAQKRLNLAIEAALKAQGALN